MSFAVAGSTANDVTLPLAAPPNADNSFTANTNWPFELAVSRCRNVDDGFAGKAPDLGACEVGQPMPVYVPG